MLPFPRCDGPCGPQGIRFTAAASADAEWSHLGADPQGALGLCANGTTGGALLSTVAFLCLFSFFCFYVLGSCECEVEFLGVFLFVDVNLCFLLNFGHSFFPSSFHIFCGRNYEGLVAFWEYYPCPDGLLHSSWRLEESNVRITCIDSEQAGVVPAVEAGLAT